MSIKNLKPKKCGSRASQLARFLHREGKKYCAVALCASLIAGNLGSSAVAADESDTREFELDRAVLYEALQEAVMADEIVDETFTFAGEAADTYDSLLNMVDDGNLYELKPEIEDNDGSLQLRVFARLDGDIELESAYEVDGSEEMIFLLTNTSKTERTAVIRVDDKTTEEIKVAPGKAVLSNEDLEAYKSAAEQAGPGMEGETAATDEGTVVSGSPASGGSGGGSGSGGGGSHSGGSNSDSSIGDETNGFDGTDAADSTQDDAPAADDRQETGVGQESGGVQDTENGDSTTDESADAGNKENQNPAGDNDTAAGDAAGGSDQNQSDVKDSDVSIDDSGKDGAEDKDHGSSDQGQASGGSQEEAGSDQSGNSGNNGNSGNEDHSDHDSDNRSDSNTGNDSGNSTGNDSGSSTGNDSGNSTGNDSGNGSGSDSGNSADDHDQGDSGEAGGADDKSDSSLAAVSYHEIYRVAATPSDAEKEEADTASPSDASDSNANKNLLDGTVYETVLMDETAVTAFVTTFADLGLDDFDLNELATDSDALRIYSTEMDGVSVEVRTLKGTFPEDAELQVTKLADGDEQYETAKEALENEGAQFDGMMALDISFLDADGYEIEPDNERNVKVSIQMNNDFLPEDADPDSLKVHHLAENEEEIQVQDVADTQPESEIEGIVEVIEEEAVVAAEFAVDSFSTFAITWNSGWSSVDLAYRTENGSGNYEDVTLDGIKAPSSAQDFAGNLSTYVPSSAKGTDGKTYSFVRAEVVDSSNRVLTSYTDYTDISNGNTFQYSRNYGYYSLRYYNGSNWSDISSGSTIRVIYEEVSPLPMFKGLDTDGTISIQLKDLDENNKINNNFQFGGTGWTGYDGGVEQGIVDNTLGSNGSPKLTAAKGGNSLNSLFSGGTSANYLFQLDDEGYYYYDSGENFAHLDTDTGEFALYEVPRSNSANMPPSEPQFLPYNTLVDDIKTGTNNYAGDPNEGKTYQYYSTGEDINYYFGMWIDFDFLMPKDGEITHEDGTTAPMVFEFEGDDDVWVFIDDVLVLDMGGVHDNYSGSIDFNSGKVVVDKATTGVVNTSISDMFRKAGETWNGADYSTHTLKFFYLERGGGGSNCKIKFNLQTIPKGTINFQKEIGYSNSADTADIEFQFNAFVNYSGDTNGNYELYTGPYEVYSITNPNVPLSTSTGAADGIIKLKDEQFARLTGENIKATSKFYIKEIGATSDKYVVTVDGTKLETLYESGTTGEEIGVQSKEYVVGDKPYVTFVNSVSVENQYNLRLEKQLSDGTTPDETFELQLLLGGTPYRGTYTVKEAGSNKEVETKTAENGVVKIKANQYAEITGLVGGNSVHVVETGLGNAYKAPSYAMTGPIVGDPTINENGIAGTVKEGKELGSEPIVTVTVTNNPKPNLTIQKQVTGNLGDRDTEFTFAIQVKDQNGNLVDVDGTYGTVIIQNGSFKLTHGQQVTIPSSILPENAWCQITEAGEKSADEDGYADGYTTTIEAAGSTIATVERIGTIEDLDQSTVVTFTNKKDVIIDAGVLLDTLPYILILAAVAAGVAFFVIRKRRSDEDDLD